MNALWQYCGVDCAGAETVDTERVGCVTLPAAPDVDVSGEHVKPLLHSYVPLVDADPPIVPLLPVIVAIPEVLTSKSPLIVPVVVTLVVPEVDEVKVAPLMFLSLQLSATVSLMIPLVPESVANCGPGQNSPTISPEVPEVTAFKRTGLLRAIIPLVWAAIVRGFASFGIRIVAVTEVPAFTTS